MMVSMVSINGRPIVRRPSRHVLAAFVLSLTGACFALAAVAMFYATQVNAPSVAQFFATVAAVLLAIAILHFVAVRGIWVRRGWAACSASSFPSRGSRSRAS